MIFARIFYLELISYVTSCKNISTFNVFETTKIFDLSIRCLWLEIMGIKLRLENAGFETFNNLFVGWPNISDGSDIQIRN